MKIGVNCGHTIGGAGYGAVGLIKESEHARLVGRALMNKLCDVAVDVVDCTIDTAKTQAEYLAAVVALANRQDLDWFISIHFNASTSHAGRGSEVYTYDGRQYPDALDVCKNLAAIGFKNRGVKSGSGLYVIRKTKAKSMLIEVCFCDNQADVNIFNKVGAESVANALFNALYDHAVKPENTIQFENDVALLKKMNNDQFVEYIGNLARKDMKTSGILASVTTAQAILEARYGKSELALNALNLGGMKANLSGKNWYSEWGGKTYQKWTKEQNEDGTYTDEFAEFRKYDCIADYLKDHSNYLQGAKKGNNLRYKGLIGCKNYRQSFQFIKYGGYATSKEYVNDLCRVVEQWNLTQFDSVEDEQAPEGKLWVVQLGAYKSKNNAETFIRQLEKMGVKSMLKQYDVE